MLRYSDDAGQRVDVGMNERLAERAIDRTALVVGVVGLAFVAGHFLSKRD